MPSPKIPRISLRGIRSLPKHRLIIATNTAGPNNAALFYMMNLYKEAFVYYNMGYASALAWGLFIVGLAITIGLFAGAKRWVYYAAGDA